jgi:uncharacterized protein (TIGR00296 family)
LVKLARQTIESHLGLIEPVEFLSKDPVLNKKCGVFVTLNVHTIGSNHSLRGCIGLPYPTTPLVKAVMQAAVSAAFEDPRFNPVQTREMNKLTLEVSVLTPPYKIQETDPDMILRLIKVGRDGLIIGRGWNKGLLLPQVPVELGWDNSQFLSQCCIKAGLPQHSWKEQGTEIYTFQAILFKEDEPNGKITRQKLSD